MPSLLLVLVILGLGPPSSLALLLSRGEEAAVEAGRATLRRLEAREQRKHDCHAEAMVKVKSQCGDELDSNALDKSLAAIRLAACDLTSALQPLPLECSGILDAEANASQVGEQSLSSCVQALSRSPQAWSSYSGYLRDVPQICFALRRWHEIDTARDLYRAAAQDGASLREVVRRHHDRQEEALESFQASLRSFDEVQRRENEVSSWKTTRMSRHDKVGLNQDRGLGPSQALARLSRHGENIATGVFETASADITRLMQAAQSEVATGLDTVLKRHAQSLEDALSGASRLAAQRLEHELVPALDLVNSIKDASSSASAYLDRTRDGLALLASDQQGAMQAATMAFAAHTHRLINESDRWDLLRSERERVEAEWGRVTMSTADRWTRPAQSYSGMALVLFGRLVGVDLYEVPTTAQGRDALFDPASSAARNARAPTWYPLDLVSGWLSTKLGLSGAARATGTTVRIIWLVVCVLTSLAVRVAHFVRLLVGALAMVATFLVVSLNRPRRWIKLAIRTVSERPSAPSEPESDRIRVQASPALPQPQLHPQTQTQQTQTQTQTQVESRPSQRTRRGGGGEPLQPLPIRSRYSRIHCPSAEIYTGSVG
ncbi:uncharacterized protein PSFLO_01288 [Pseudozyma flocculosa]|uniref:Nuclear fusion protein KAR5 n=1 Tax=Pseudozyma flocculosa TaxID=84751 RepID=A0A5C3EWI5_9BASI|nr:uncharacterized protein PSFLO_01288 [Pseudozyma flocculosa]